jgi:NAD(P)H-dependent flavin oxidoreductase YrpB (nitropropane dioxygenase family)
VTHPALRTKACEVLGCELPIVQTGMGWVSDSPLTAATSAAGGFGILGGVTMDLDELRAAVKDVKERTDRPFGVNLRADQPDIRDRVDFLVQERVRVASFAMAPTKDVVDRLHDGGVLVMPSIGAKRHGEKVAELGVDAVIAQGGEGGGHTGPVATTLLLPQVVDVLAPHGIPVIAAGGFFDGRGLVAALAYGAAGIAMGTRFVLTRESPVPDAVKQFYLSKSVVETVVTTQVDGVPHRVLKTELVEGLERGGRVRTLARAFRNAAAFHKLSGTSWPQLLREGMAMRKRHGLTWSQVFMAGNTPILLRRAMVEGDAGAGVMASGQVVGVIDDLPTVAELVSRIAKEAEETLGRLTTG